MLWLYLAITAYFINAVVFVIDKYLLAAPIPKYRAYAFGVSVLSLGAVFLIPFGVSWYGLNYFLIAVSAGASFFIGLIFLYRAIRESDISVLRNKQSELRYLLGQVVSIKSKLKALTYADVKEKKRLYLELEKIKSKEEEILISLNN